VGFLAEVTLEDLKKLLEELKASPERAANQAINELDEFEGRTDVLPFIPKSEWEHKTFLADTTRVREKASLFELITKEMVLANIETDRFLWLYQIQGTNVLEWHFLGITNLEQLRLGQFLVELNLTRAKKFAERKLQAGQDKAGEYVKMKSRLFKKERELDERAGTPEQR
jgi:hypothetical protein